MSSPTLHRPVLLIDDDHEDLFLVKRLLARSGVKHPIVTIDSGEEAIVFLRAATLPGAAELLPCAIFCDVRMPKVDGFEVLKWARGVSALANTRFAILSGGNVDKDRARAKELGADYFLVKFPAAEELKKIIDSTDEACPPPAANSQ